MKRFMELAKRLTDFIENEGIARYGWMNLSNDMRIYFNSDFTHSAVEFGSFPLTIECSITRNKIDFNLDCDLDLMYENANDSVTAYIAQEHAELKAKAAELIAKRIEELETELNNLKNK